MLPKAKIAAVVAIDEVLMRVRDASNWRGNSGVRYTMANAAPMPAAQPDIKMAYATEGNVAADPYAGFETRVVPENVTLLPKTKDQVTGGNPTDERVHIVKKGDSIAIDPARPGRDGGRGQGDRRHARPPRPRRRAEGRPEAAAS